MDIPTYNRCTIPPCICRLLGKTKDGAGERPWTDRELMARTGWGYWRLRAVYSKATWQDVTVGDQALFLWALGMHPSRQKRYVWLLERARRDGNIRRLRHLRPRSGWREFQIVALVRMAERVGNEYRSAA